MYKKYLIFTFSLFLSSAIASNSVPFNQKNVVIAWDFNDVLVKKDWPVIAEGAFSIIKNDWKILSFLIWPPFYYTAYTACKNCATTETILSTVVEKYPSLKQHEEDLFKLFNVHKPMTDSVALLEKLKNCGYKNYLASNMDKKSYKLAKEEFKEIFDQLEGVYFPERNISIKAKPCIDYYLALRDYLASQGVDKNCTIIFIDDRKENILGAVNSNHHEFNHIYGIHFTSAQDLEETLKKIILFD